MPKTGPRKFWRTLFSQYVLQQTDAEVPNNLLGTAAKETARKSVHRGSVGIRSGETTRKVFFMSSGFRSNILRRPLQCGRVAWDLEEIRRAGCGSAAGAYMPVSQSSAFALGSRPAAYRFGRNFAVP